jgi:hypothetical protein
MRHSIHIFFPGLVSNERESPLLTEDEIATFYEKGLRSYIKKFDKERASDWPPDYKSEKFRATKKKGQSSFRNVMLSDWLVKDFGVNLLKCLEENGVEWAKDFFFIHTIRGTKNPTAHNLTREGAHNALKVMLKEAFIPPSALEDGSWWIDVGLEFHSLHEDPHCLQWMTVSHPHVVQNALDIDARDATRITTLGSTKYSRDLASHLPGVSGFRIEPGPRAKGPYQAAYLQIYTTDKSVTYHPQGHSYAKEVTIWEAMGDKQPVPFLMDLYTTYCKAAKETSSNARMEVRVPITFAEEVLMDIDATVIWKSLISVPREQWW